MPKPEISVLLVDDHSLVRHGFRRMLEEEDIRVVGEASDGDQAVECAKQLAPSVVVMDFALPSMNGAVATRRILEILPDTAVLILSMHSEPNYVRTCLDAGARGYLLKNAMDLELVEAVLLHQRPDDRTVVGGDVGEDQVLVGSDPERALVGAGDGPQPVHHRTIRRVDHPAVLHAPQLALPRSECREHGTCPRGRRRAHEPF